MLDVLKSAFVVVFNLLKIQLSPEKFQNKEAAIYSKDRYFKINK